MSVKLRHASNWKELFKAWVRQNGTWKQCDKIWMRHNGKWVVIWNAEPLWGEWSAWQGTQVTAIEGQREVRSEPQHRYQTYGMCYNFDDQFSPRNCHDRRSQDDFIKSPSCHNCGYRKAHEWLMQMVGTNVYAARCSILVFVGGSTEQKTESLIGHLVMAAAIQVSLEL